MRTSRKYRISPALISDLCAAVIANGGASRGAVIHTVNPNHYGDYLVEVIGLADNTFFDDVCKLAYTAEQGKAVLLPALNRRSVHVGDKGEQYTFDGDLYHIGAWTNPSYGVQYIHRFQTLDGEKNELSWTTGRYQALGHYTVSCKIKDHTNYGGVYQTAITYCKFELLEE